MVLRAPREIVSGDVPRPEANSRDVIVRVTHSGICGTDYKIYSGAIPVSYPRVMGHEITGEVADPGSSAVRQGDRVIVDPQLYCGSCFHCRIGQTHLCPKGILIGRDVNGGFAELVSAPASHVFRLPDSIDSRTAPLIQVLTTCLHAQQQVAIRPGETVVVFGLGVTGQLHVQLAKAAGASTVIGITRSADKRALAETLGADLTLVGDEAAITKVREATDGRGADVVIETTGMLPSLSSGQRRLPAFLRFVFQGAVAHRRACREERGLPGSDRARRARRCKAGAAREQRHAALGSRRGGRDAGI
jgi:2-desacetyl-2-hydroxyethyl bacteriochlorophyllide A dehydrogenase